MSLLDPMTINCILIGKSKDFLLCITIVDMSKISVKKKHRPKAIKLTDNCLWTSIASHVLFTNNKEMKTSQIVLMSQNFMKIYTEALGEHFEIQNCIPKYYSLRVLSTVMEAVYT